MRSWLYQGAERLGSGTWSDKSRSTAGRRLIELNSFCKGDTAWLYLLLPRAARIDLGPDSTEKMFETPYTSDRLIMI